MLIRHTNSKDHLFVLLAAAVRYKQYIYESRRAQKVHEEIEYAADNGFELSEDEEEDEET
jgi:hypothetical protein